jgi:hypothetical protein
VTALSSSEAQYFPSKYSRTKTGTFAPTLTLRTRSLRTTFPGKTVFAFLSSSGTAPASYGQLVRNTHLGFTIYLVAPVPPCGRLRSGLFSVGREHVRAPGRWRPQRRGRRPPLASRRPSSAGAAEAQGRQDHNGLHIRNELWRSRGSKASRPCAAGSASRELEDYPDRVVRIRFRRQMCNGTEVSEL